MERLTYRDNNGRALLTHFGKQMYCSTQATADCVCMLEERLKEAISMLKAKEPIKPTVSVDTWICTECGHTLESQELIDDKENPQILVHEQYQYCPNCGRAVKWNE